MEWVVVVLVQASVFQARSLHRCLRLSLLPRCQGSLSCVLVQLLLSVVLFVEQVGLPAGTGCR